MSEIQVGDIGAMVLKTPWSDTDITFGTFAIENGEPGFVAENGKWFVPEASIRLGSTPTEAAADVERRVQEAARGILECSKQIAHRNWTGQGWNFRVNHAALAALEATIAAYREAERLRKAWEAYQGYLSSLPTQEDLAREHLRSEARREWHEECRRDVYGEAG